MPAFHSLCPHGYTFNPFLYLPSETIHRVINISLNTVLGNLPQVSLLSKGWTRQPQLFCDPTQTTTEFSSRSLLRMDERSGSSPRFIASAQLRAIASYTSVPIFRGVTDAHHTRSCFRLNHKGYPHPPLHGLKKKQTNTGHFSHYIFKELRNHEVSQTRSKMKRGVPSHCVSQSSSAEPGSAFLSCALFKLR